MPYLILQVINFELDQFEAAICVAKLSRKYREDEGEWQEGV